MTGTKKEPDTVRLQFPELIFVRLESEHPPLRLPSEVVDLDPPNTDNTPK